MKWRPSGKEAGASQDRAGWLVLQPAHAVAAGRRNTVQHAIRGEHDHAGGAPTTTAPRNIEDGLYRVSASGGEVTPVTKLDRSKRENSHRWPQFLPNGVIFSSLRAVPYPSIRAFMSEHQARTTGSCCSARRSTRWLPLYRDKRRVGVSSAPTTGTFCSCVTRRSRRSRSTWTASN